MHDVVQRRNATAPERLRHHRRRERPNLDDVILEPERPRLPRNRAQENGRIRKPVIFTPKDELRVRQLAPDDLDARASELPVL